MPLLDASMATPLPEKTGATAPTRSQSQSQSRPDRKPHPPTSFKRTPSSWSQLPTIPAIPAIPDDTDNETDNDKMISFMRFSRTQSELEMGAETASAFSDELEAERSATSTWSYRAPAPVEQSARLSRESKEGRRSFDTFGQKDRRTDRFSVNVDEQGLKGASTDDGVSSTSGMYHTAMDELDRHRPAGAGLTASAETKGSETHKVGEERKGNQIDALPGKVFRFDKASRPLTSGPVPDRRDDKQAVHFNDSKEPKVIPRSGEGILRNPSVSRHRPTASVPHFEPIQDPHAPQIQQSPIQHTPSPRTRTRSRSIDSVSLHPSLSDSVTNLLVLPTHTIPAFPRPVLEHRSTSSILPQELIARNHLNTEQSAILLRRARKLEQILGQSLDERSIERLLIDPITAPRTITTHATDQAWPESPGSKSTKSREKEGRRKSLAEWQRDDCVPRLDRAGGIENQAQANTNTGPSPTPSHSGLARSGSFLARKAKNALGMGTVAAEKKKGKSDLAVYVSREVRVQESSEGGIKPSRQTASTPPGTAMPFNRAGSGSPGSPTPTAAESSHSDDELRRTRRLQLAKLHRLLGVPIPPDLIGLGRQSQDSHEAPFPEPEVGQQNDHSFISFDDSLVTPSTNWSAALKHTLNKVRSRDKDGRQSASPAPTSTPPAMSREASYVDMGTVGAMNEKEKAVARKKAQKLEYMFGDAPPQSMFLPRPATPAGFGDHHSSTSTNTTSQDAGRARQFSQGSYEAYESSLSGLLYLADNDSATLDTLMDQLELDDGDHSIQVDTTATGLSQPLSPSNPTPGPHTHEARRKRTGKLTHFFGETGIDFDDPPNVADTMERVRSRSNTNTNLANTTVGGGKGDTLDGIMREMWRGVQAEVRRGGMAVKEGERLGEMIDRLRRRRGSEGRWEVL